MAPTGRYAFVSLEASDEIAVFNLSRALKDGFPPSDLVGYIPTAGAPVGLAVSPDGRYLYATSESQAASRQGLLYTISLQRAEADPAHAIISTVPAGCGAVRVTAAGAQVVRHRPPERRAGAVLGSSPGDTPRPMPWSTGPSGEAPVGVVAIDQGRRIVVADSNRFAVGKGSANLAVVDVSSSGQLRLAGYVTAGGQGRSPGTWQ